MTNLTSTKLNEAQEMIYTISNVCRAYPDYENRNLTKISKRDDGKLIITDEDGKNFIEDAKPVQDAFVRFTNRTPHFFKYLNPNYGGKVYFKDGAYMICKGDYKFGYANQRNQNIEGLQRRFVEGMTKLRQNQPLAQPSDLAQILQRTSSKYSSVPEEFRQPPLGYVVYPYGLPDKPKHEQIRIQNLFDIEDETDEIDVKEIKDKEDKPKKMKTPYCYCPSYQRQLRCKSLLKDEIEGYQIGCKHISWIQKFDEFLGRKSTLEKDLEKKDSFISKVVVWGYFPPTDPKGQGIFRVFYSNKGINAPKKDWKELVENDKPYTVHDVWNLFHRMLSKEYVPYCGHQSNGVPINQALKEVFTCQ